MATEPQIYAIACTTGGTCAIGTCAIGTCAIGTCAIGTCAIGTCAIGTCAIGTCAIGIIARPLLSEVKSRLAPGSSVVCLLSSAERSPDESGARRETIYMQFKPNLNIFEKVPSSSMVVTYIPSDTRHVKKTNPILTQSNPILTQSNPILTQTKPNFKLFTGDVILRKSEIKTPKATSHQIGGVE